MEVPVSVLTFDISKTKNMASAYYSRNNSYSRSYGASCAEAEGRYSLTRAAKEMGLSSVAFKAGLAKAGYRSTEWHHVGKYANTVDYYDTTELQDNIMFWIGAKTKANKGYVEKEIKRLLWVRMNERLEVPVLKQVSIVRSYYSDNSYDAQMVADHRLGKAIGEIRRMRKAAERKTAVYGAEGLSSFILYADGRIKDSEGKLISAAGIDWTEWEPNNMTKSGKGVRFYKQRFSKK